MKSKAIINVILFLACVAAIALILTQPAHAIGTPQVDPASSVASSAASAASTASSASSSAVDLSLATNPVQSFRGGESYALAAPASAAPLPPGLCPKGDSESYSIVWGFVSWSKSSTRTEMECLDKVLTMLRDVAPKQAVVNYVTPAPEPAKVEPKPAAEDARLSGKPTTPALVCVKDKPKTATKAHVKAPKKCG